MSEGETWKSRKQLVREKFLTQLETTPATEDGLSTPAATTGSAPSGAAVSVDLFEKVERPGPASSATSATATGLRAKPPGSLASMMPAVSTKSSSESSTVWMESPLGFIEKLLKPSIVDPHGSLLPGLPPAVHASLHRLAIARSEPVADVVQQIAEFFVEEEDERAEGPLGEALTFYMEQYVGSAV